MMGKIAILDRDPAAFRRDWQEILDPSSVVCVSSLRKLGEEDCDMIIAHSLEPDAPSLIAMSERKGIPVIIVSGSADDVGPCLVADQVYRRKASVKTGADFAFGRCVKRFLSVRLEAGESKWDLLEPPAWSEGLVGYYLLLTSLCYGTPSECKVLNEQLGKQESVRFHQAVTQEIASLDRCLRDQLNTAGLSDSRPIVSSTTRDMDLIDIRRHLTLLSQLLPQPLELQIKPDRKAPFTHTWLKNRLLAQIRVDRDMWLNRPVAEGMPPVISGIFNRLNELASFMKEAEAIYSPGQLSGSWPLSELPILGRAIVRDVCHRLYLKDTEWVEKSSLIAKLSGSLQKHAEQLNGVWTEVASVEDREQALIAVEQDGMALKAVLEQLPNGIRLHEEREL